MEKTIEPVTLPLELLEEIIHFSIRVRSLKGALRLRLVNRHFRTLIEENMFRTRFLDESVHAMREKGNPFRYSNPQRPVGRDSAWLTFLKRYLSHRIYTQPNLHPLCPEHLIHRAADWLGKTLNDKSDTARRYYIDTLCQVGFWEYCCCYERLLPQYPPCLSVDDSSNYIDSTPNYSALSDGDAALKRLLLEAAIYLGDIDLARKFYQLKPWEGYHSGLETSHAHIDTAAAQSGMDRNRLALVHGGVEMFKLVNKVEFGIETKDQYVGIYDPAVFMEYVVRASRDHASTDRINFLLDLGAPWDDDPTSYWMKFEYPHALIQAPTPEIYERLIAILSPEKKALSFYRVKLCCRKDSMILQLDRSAGVNNLVMVKYHIDHGGAPYLNNIHTDCQERSARSNTPRGYWQQWRLHPLVRAVEVGNLDMVRLMLDHGADPNHNPFNTPLMAAVRHRHLGIARLLIEHGADVNLGSTPPVVLAVQREDVEMLQLLWGNGAVIDRPEIGGRAMAVVVEEGLDSMRDLLVDRGVERDGIWNHVQSEEEFVLELRYREVYDAYRDYY
ncbi:Ankyrin repeat-containing protein [Glarea lozoyensis ATCC 20868]|uniref:Ankyrin repeat-containing protein n=1 Tax=Glarea lozoyensis (strain ATCC 20868 / MF5171) TaxID=1116229 RepID=S3CSK2_GLAL2|nr:Ankyrin repeat-containing protein [Glarea lozoyensis ATCC 20868]EPE28645.1 Ankyrin repeat-containing protein [Glarea lozoyensis ATCC 20868]